MSMKRVSCRAPGPDSSNLPRRTYVKKFPLFEDEAYVGLQLSVLETEKIDLSLHH